MNIFPAGSSLIDIITRAKAMQGKDKSATPASAPSPAETQQKKLEEQVTLSPKLQEKINAGKKVNAYLQVFSTALKLVNTGTRLPDMTSYLDKLDNSGKPPTRIDTKI